MAIVLHGNNATGNTPADICGAVPTSYSQAYNLKKSGSPVNNDEARSRLLMDVPEGTQIAVADDPNDGTNDDCTVITALEYVQEPIEITTFENSWQTDQLKVRYHHVNGLDGRVSYVGIQGS
ncbi:hypothetical protein ACFRQM_44675 [Streptomyces sp. NPDC056831]|uniref:hypothetical protein n=1 Tax=Streptomyces sp. NPDC056831 TaxID=3345954 RepID=UPI003697045E